MIFIFMNRKKKQSEYIGFFTFISLFALAHLDGIKLNTFCCTVAAENRLAPYKTLECETFKL